MPNGVLLGRNQTLKGEIQKQIIDFNGEPQEKTVVPSVEAVVVEPDKSKRLTKVTVLGVTSEIDENISPMNIRRGKTILGVEGNLEPDKPDQSKTVKPSVDRRVVRADTGYELASVTVEGVTSDIDEDIQPENIRYGVEILGVVGSMEQREDLDAELEAQESLISALRTQVDEIPSIDVESADATESDVKKGKTFFSGDTEIKTGTLEVPDLSATTATAEDVLQGKQFYNAEGEFVEGGYKDMLNRQIQVTKSCANLFKNFPDEDMSWVKNLDTSQSKNMQYMFNNCSNVLNLDLSNFDTSNVTTMRGIFYYCSALKSIDVSSFNTSKVTDMYDMFMRCKELESLDLSNFDTSNNTYFQEMFMDCYKLKQLDLSNFNTSKATSFYYTFLGCNALTDLNLSGWDSSKVTDMTQMFQNCRSLTSLDLSSFDTSKVTKLNEIFYLCRNLETILGTLDLISTTNNSSMFSLCNKLENVTLKNIKISLSMSDCEALTNETLINTIQELWDLTGSTSQTLRLHSTSKTKIANIYVKLIPVTDEMRAEDEYIDNKKPCVVCESTDEGAMTLTEYAISKNWAIG